MRILSLLCFLCFVNSELLSTDSFYRIYQDRYKIGNIYGQNTSLDHKSILKNHFNVLTPENWGKWSFVQPIEGAFDFIKMDEIVHFAEENNMDVVGHTLVWGSQTPSWVFRDIHGNPAGKDLLLKRMKDHIDANMKRYLGRIKYWDVVNEAFNGDGSYRSNDWFQILGPEYIEQAFLHASKIDPSARLLYNDYNMVKVGRVEAVIKMVENLRSKNIPIHGIGIQGHWMLDFPEMAELDFVLKKLKEQEISVHITELDISVLPSPYKGANIATQFENSPEKDPYTLGMPMHAEKELNKRYLEIFKLFNKYDNIERVTFWGVSDGDSWKNEHPIKGRTDYPLLFDRKLKKKSVFDKILELENKNK